MRRIVVLGAGFGGLSAVSALERALEKRRRVELVLVSDQPNFLFTPLLPNVANGELPRQTIELPLSGQLASDTELIVDRVVGLDLDRRELIGERGPIGFDYAVLAPGAEIDWMGHDDWKPHAMTCKSAWDAAHIRDTIRRAYAEASALGGEARERALTFVFAGGGPTGVELAAELLAGLRLELWPQTDPALVEATRFVIVEPRRHLLADLPEFLQHAAYRRLDEHRVELRLGESVVHRTADAVGLSGGEEIPCAHFFWCAGVRPSSLVQDAGFRLDSRGRVRVDDGLEALGHDGIFVIGDAARTPDNAPQCAQAAKQQGPTAAANAVAALSGRAPSPWHFKPQGDLITLGRGHAAISLRGVELDGAAAYAMYRLAYAALMPGPLKKLSVLKDWFEHDLQTRTTTPQRLLGR